MNVCRTEDKDLIQKRDMFVLRHLAAKYGFILIPVKQESEKDEKRESE